MLLALALILFSSLSRLYPQFRDPVRFAGNDFETEPVEGKDLTDFGDDLGFVNHQTGHGVGFVIRQAPIGGAIKVSDRHGPVDQE